jgi:hypothetical protein
MAIDLVLLAVARDRLARALNVSPASFEVAHRDGFIEALPAKEANGALSSFVCSQLVFWFIKEANGASLLLMFGAHHRGDAHQGGKRCAQ